jgi:ornithine carbamoyltransferase
MIAASMFPKDFISLESLSSEAIESLIDLGIKVKANPPAYRESLRGRTLAMIFEKHSTRTRVSFEVGMFQLGGAALFLGSDTLHLGRGESLADTARVLSRFVDAIVARVYAHASIVELARNATVPVINGLSDALHPCQALADFMTLRERFRALKGLKLAYVGDGNNVCAELLLGGVKLGLRVCVASPHGYWPEAAVVASAVRDAQHAGAPIPEIVLDPMAAVDGADAVYTDVWTSMGQEAEMEERKVAFAGYTVTPAMMTRAHPKAVFMHCLPAHRGEEVAAEVIDGPQSVVFDEAENRLHAQKALLMRLLSRNTQELRVS